MRVLCLDVGAKKIGIAVSDPTGILAQGLKLYRRDDIQKDLAELRKIAGITTDNPRIPGCP